MRVPGGGASCLGVGRQGTGTLPPPTSRPFGCAAGAHYPLAVGAGGAGMGTRHRPYSARSCALWGRHEGARGGRLLPGCGASGVGRSFTPDHSSFRACGRRPLPTGCRCGGCGRGDPSTTPQRALLRAGFARCGGGMRVPGGGASCLGVGRPGTGALPPPTSRPFGRAAGANYPLAAGVGGAGAGTRHQPHSARSFVLWGRHQGARGGGMRVPGGGASCLDVGPPGTGALPPPTSRQFRRAVGAHYPLAVGAGGAGVETRHRHHSARSCVLFVRHEGARGGRILLRFGASRDRCPPTPDLSSIQACDPGPLPTGCGCGGSGRGDPSPTPQRALL